MRAMGRKQRYLRRDCVGRSRGVSREEARAIFDRVARENMHMSGEEFLRRYHEGTLGYIDRPEVMRVLMLKQLGEQ